MRAVAKVQVNRFFNHSHLNSLRCIIEFFLLRNSSAAQVIVTDLWEMQRAPGSESKFVRKQIR
jgi:hypothetical protein